VVQGACHHKFPLVDTYMSAPEAEIYVSFQKNLAKSPEIFESPKIFDCKHPRNSLNLTVLCSQLEEARANHKKKPRRGNSHQGNMAMQPQQQPIS
jgi:hypothetical protein